MNETMGMLENILFAAGDSVSVEELADVLGLTREDLEIQLTEEIRRREEADTGLLIRRLEDRVQLCTRPTYASLLFALFGEQKNPDLTRAMLEALAIVAYRQPVTRAEVDQLRGVNSTYIMNALSERGLIKEVGRKQVVGLPILYATTEQFLRQFGLTSLEELPRLAEAEVLAEGLTEAEEE